MEDVTTAQTSGSAANKNVLQLANEISRKLNNIDAQESGVSPSKSEIIDEINNVVQEICGKERWTFLKTVMEVDGYEVDTDSEETLSGGDASDTVDSNLGGGTGTSYWAEKITAGADYLVSPVTCIVGLAPELDAQGGLLNGTMTLYICPDSNGSPDIDNPIFTATAIVITDGVTDTGVTLTGNQRNDVTFTFADVTDVLLKSTDYWWVLKYEIATGTPENGDSLVVTRDATTSGTTKTMLEGAATWTAFTTGSLYFVQTYNPADYILTLTLDESVDEILRLFAGSVTEPSPNVKNFSGATFMYDPDALPKDKFVIRKHEDGAYTILLDSSVGDVKTWYLEYIKIPDTLSDDLDVPVIPKSFRSMIMHKCVYNFIDAGQGKQSASLRDKSEKTYEGMLEDLKMRYLPKMTQGAGVKKGSKIRGYTATIPLRHNMDRRT